ncbi:MAG: glycosyl hydrolase family 8 [Brevinematales bacterium]|nr:glycosyl hydrolase family 8 [Brevinematales bacterium]
MEKKFIICFSFLFFLFSCNIQNFDEKTEILGGKNLNKATLWATIEAENMAKGGSYASYINTPFNGVALYGGNDYCSTNFYFTNIPGQYQIEIRGQSSTSTPAIGSIYIGGTKVGELSFGNSVTVTSLTCNIQSTPNLKEIKITGEKDNGSWDLYIDWIKIYYIGSPPALPPAPSTPSQGVWYSGTYRNLFKERGYSETEINAKINTAVSNFFYGPDDIRCYYPVGSDMAYILDSGNNDVRSEGMSYGMMIAVQMNMKNEFDRLWKWAKTYMQHQSGDRIGYFAWQCSTSGNKIDNNPAPDGEEYFAMALYFAWKRWGNGTGIFNYKAEADNILHHMLHQDQYAGQYSGVTKMINTQSTQICFVPYGSSYEHTDPSYHLPAFYELWARWANADNAYWSQVAKVSREFFKKTCHPTTGLNPDYANFDGTPKNDGGHGDFRFDAWRTIMNIVIDYYWWGVDSWAVTQANRLQDFFKAEGVSTHGNQYSLSGQKLASDHSPGLVAMNAVAGLIANKQQVWEFIDELWNIQPTRGQYRYYDGCLYLFGLLHCSGKFQIWGRDGSSSSSTSSSSSISSSSITTSSSSSSTSSRISSSSSSSLSSSSSSSSSSISSRSSSSVTSSSSSSSSGYINPYNQVEIENYSSQNGVSVISGDGGTVVRFNSTTSWVAFNCDFGSSEPSGATFRAKDPAYGANIIIRMDSPNGQEIGRVYPSGGGVWNTASNGLYPRPTGKRTIYIMVSSPNVEINWFKFQ